MKTLLVVVACAACVEPAPPIEPQVTSHTARMPFLASTSNKVDLLFVVDSSPAIAPYRAHLDARLPLLMDALGDLPTGLPDLHIGAISANGDGRMHGRGQMTGVFLSDVPAINGTRTRNYLGSLTAAFREYADLGTESTTPSRPLEAIELALRSPQNAGFEREHAHLAIVLATATDDTGPRSVSEHATTLKQRVTDPTRIAVSAITGPDAPRIHAFLEQFPSRNASALISDADLVPALAPVNLLIKTTLPLHCWPSAPIDVDLVTTGMQYECAAYLAAYGRADTGVVIPECDAAPTSACWRVVEQPLCSGPLGSTGLSTRLEPLNLSLPQGTEAWIECVVAPPSSQNP